MDIHKNPCWYERDHKNDAQPLAQSRQNTPRASNYDSHLGEEGSVKTPGCHIVGHEGTFRKSSAYHSQTSVHFSY